MKTMTCKQLGGACDLEFQTESFDEMAQLNREHVINEGEQNDEAHLKAINEMQELMKSPDAMKAWFDGKRNEFDALTEDDS